ncbi:hypothetical protein SKAU_G00277070 [Synaphobranchus kaupii]|uniref:Uncharacterized protein n=1 Tax=Synaphobranchus kaupii TaxID=118154 RepID=A0A9Q1F1G9_SYNKA|nr:hypothetical protein SKAU_G00277070 [Synaphobranchus kaupii]
MRHFTAPVFHRSLRTVLGTAVPERGEDKTSVQIPMETSKLLQPPKNTEPRCDPSDINISDEMSKTTVWKSLSRPLPSKKK